MDTWTSALLLIVTRSEAAAERLRDRGHGADRVTSDNAFNFDPRPEDGDWARGLWPKAEPPPVGIAAVDFHRWPVVVRPWGRSRDRYRWPYYSPPRRRASAKLATLFPRSLGNPPILTIIALAKRVARICSGKKAPVRIQAPASRRSPMPPA